MIQILGLIALISLVFGALLSAGGGIFQALPLEFLLIGGSSLGILIISNAPKVAVESLTGFGKVVRGPKWKQADYTRVLTLLYDLLQRAQRSGMVAIESDIEHPEGAASFRKAPKVLGDTGARDLICDTLRHMSLDLSDMTRATSAAERSIIRHTDARMRAANALFGVADALPALGIVAAVIGIIRTMGAIDQSTTIIGQMMAVALLGTFLGVFLAYGIVGPVAARLAQIIEEEEQFLQVIHTVLSAYAAGLAPLSAVELGRAEIPGDIRLTSEELNRALQTARFQARRSQVA